MDCCSPHMGPHLVVQGLRPLEPLDNALVRYKSFSIVTRPYWTSSIGSLVCQDFWPPTLVHSPPPERLSGACLTRAFSLTTAIKVTQYASTQIYLILCKFVLPRRGVGKLTNTSLDDNCNCKARALSSSCSNSSSVQTLARTMHLQSSSRQVSFGVYQSTVLSLSFYIPRYRR